MAIGKLIIRIISAGASAAGIVAYLRYRKEMKSIRACIESGSTIAETAAGPVEYAESGEGEPMLVIHGAGGGYDQGLLIGSDLGEGYRVIAPSRFGYLKTLVPDDSSPTAQADVHAALLDFLDIAKAVVVGVSAGAPSAIELALRHPNKVSALILLVPRTYDPTQSIGVDESAQSQAVLRLVEASVDFPFWAAMRISRSSVVRFLGVPPDVERAASEDDRQRVTHVMRSILPLSSRVRGVAADSSVEISPWPLERISAPTLIVSAEDDLFRTLPGARFTAEHIKGAELHVLKSGGHLMVGRTAKVRALVCDFIERHRRKEIRHPSSNQARQQELESAEA